MAQNVERTARAKAVLKGKGVKTGTERSKASRLRSSREDLATKYVEAGGKGKVGLFKNYNQQQVNEAKLMLRSDKSVAKLSSDQLKTRVDASLKVKAAKKGIRDGTYSVRDIEKMRSLKQTIAQNERNTPKLEKKLSLIHI